MDQMKLAKQFISFYKTTFDSSFNAMTILQEQTERMVALSLGQLPWMPEEGRKAVEEWVKAYKQGREDYKAMADESYKKVEVFFNSSKAEDLAEDGGKSKKAKG